MLDTDTGLSPIKVSIAGVSLRKRWTIRSANQRLPHLGTIKSVIPENNGNGQEAVIVSGGYRLGTELGVRATPAIVLPGSILI